MIKGFALAWRRGGVVLVELQTEGTRLLAEHAAPGAIGAHRHDLALFTTADGQVIVRLAGGGRAPFLRGGEQALVAVEPVPGDGALAAPACRAHGNGILSAIDGQRLWLRPRVPELWLPVALPSDMRAHDVSITGSGDVVVVGDLPAGASDQRAAAMAVVHSDGTALVTLALSDPDRRLLVSGGGAESLRRVDVETTPYLLSSSCAWLHEDPSDFLLVGSGKAWTVRRLPRQAIRSWQREGTTGLAVYTAEGRRHRTRDFGSTYEERDFRPAIADAWSGARSGEPIVRAVAAREYVVVLAVSSYDFDAPAGGELQGSALLASVDDGVSFSVISTAEPGEEWVGVALG